MKFKGTYLLLIFGLALGSYIYLVELKKDPAAEEGKFTFAKFDLDKVTKLTFKNSHGEFTAEKTPDHWNLVSPVLDKADGATINSILSTISTEKSDRSIPEATDLKIFGLDKEKITLEIFLKDQPSLKISIGDDTPTAGKLYLKLGDKPGIIVAGSLMKSQIDKPLKDLREKRIFRESKDKIKAVTVKTVKKGVILETILEKKSDVWELAKSSKSEGEVQKADKEAAQGLINQIDGLRANDFSSEKADDQKTRKEFMLEPAETEITILDGEKKVLAKIFFSGKKENNSYVRVEGVPTIYQIYSSSGEAFAKGSDDYRDKKGPFEFDKSLVKEIEIKTDQFETRILNRENSWKLASDDQKKEVNQVQVGTLLSKLQDLKVSEFLSAGVPDSKLHRRLALKDDKGKDVLTLLWGEKTKTQKYFVKSSRDQKLYGVETASLDGIPAQTLLKEKGAPEAKEPAQTADPKLPFGSDAPMDSHEHGD